jgi:hypothetical protein
VFNLDVVACSLRCVQAPAGGIFICHRRRSESNFTRETFRQCIGQILLRSKHEGTEFELALDIGFHPVDQTDAGKVAREVGLSTTRDNGLVPNQKKRRDDALGVWEAFSNACYGNALRAQLTIGAGSDWRAASRWKEPTSDSRGYKSPHSAIPNIPNIYESVLTGFWVVYARHVFLLNNPTKRRRSCNVYITKRCGALADI